MDSSTTILWIIIRIRIDNNNSNMITTPTDSLGGYIVTITIVVTIIVTLMIS